jgi:hypothetical protein
MKSVPSAIACFAVVGLLLTAATNVAVAAGKQSASNPSECFTDDGYGRKRSCAASRYRRKEADRNPSECFTDGGNGGFCLDKVKR